MLLKFIELGLEINSQDKHGKTPLHLAVQKQSEEALSYLLQQNPDINRRDNEGCTPLHTLVMYAKNFTNAEEMVPTFNSLRAILLKGAKTDIRDNYGLTFEDYIA